MDIRWSITYLNEYLYCIQTFVFQHHSTFMYTSGKLSYLKYICWGIYTLLLKSSYLKYSLKLYYWWFKSKNLNVICLIYFFTCYETQCIPLYLLYNGYLLFFCPLELKNHQSWDATFLWKSTRNFKISKLQKGLV